AAAAAALRQPWSDNAEYARQLAASADHQFLLVKYAVGQTARDADLRDLMARPAPDARPLQEYLEKTKREFLRWFTRPGEEPPIVNWFVMDADGTILADSYEDPSSVGKKYDFRDYFDCGPYFDRVQVDVYKGLVDNRSSGNGRQWTAALLPVAKNSSPTPNSPPRSSVVCSHAWNASSLPSLPAYNAANKTPMPDTTSPA